MNPTANIIALHQPRRLAFGAGCAARAIDDLRERHCQRVLLVASRSTRRFCAPFQSAFATAGSSILVWDKIDAEPTVETFRQAMTAARDFRPDAVVGIGGGSVLDIAKLVAAMLGSDLDIRDAFGIGKISGRSIHLACLPTTAGTGSEVSPNAILLDEADQLKKGVISPHLMPDAAYVDPALTLSVPPAVTSATGMDALTHCIEAYANRFAHPLIDLYALQGIRLIAQSLEQAVRHGDDLAARMIVALGSMYGGMCLGPVNTGAVHALAYPLGGEFHIAHGVSNALLLPHVLAFNLPAAPQRYAQIAIAMGEPMASGASDLDTAARGVARVADLSRRCGVPQRLSQIGIPESAIERMAKAAMTVTRLLERNVRQVTLNDAIAIYRSAF
ncbi:MAG TPA: iron-containing alcohol dehydrogenase [Tepidisphaeraceae bacterium]|nr:iron-containing alcohol dehydrogenase [Tepidisphaeraceae bacterium]